MLIFSKRSWGSNPACQASMLAQNELFKRKWPYLPTLNHRESIHTGTALQNESCCNWSWTICLFARTRNLCKDELLCLCALHWGCSWCNSKISPPSSFFPLALQKVVSCCVSVPQWAQPTVLPPGTRMCVCVRTHHVAPSGGFDLHIISMKKKLTIVSVSVCTTCSSSVYHQLCRHIFSGLPNAVFSLYANLQKICSPEPGVKSQHVSVFI